MSKNRATKSKVFIVSESNKVKTNVDPVKDSSLHRANDQQDKLEKQNEVHNQPRKSRQSVSAQNNSNREKVEFWNSDNEPKQKEDVRKRGRPRKPVKPSGEKKKPGRPKDETKCNITCDICGKFFRHRCNFIIHERSHYGIREFECEYCHKRFVQKTQLNVHRRLHTGEKPFKCPHCPDSFRVQALLDGHVFKHTGIGTKCPQCQSIFPTPAQAKQHIRDVHATEKSYVCQICGQSYKMRRSLKIHLENHDKRICAVCGKVFNTMHALMTHRHIHEFNKKCNYCNRSFKSEEELQAHSKLRGRVYQCDMCCYSFNKTEFLNNHNRRDHWKEMGLEQLPRKKAKPEDCKVQAGLATVEYPALSSAETSQHAMEPFESTTVQSDLPSAPAWCANVGLVSPKMEQLDNQVYITHGENETQTFKQNISEEVDCESKVEVKVDTEVVSSFKPAEFVKVEIYQEEDTSAPKEDPTESRLEEKEDNVSDSEDEEVPLAVSSFFDVLNRHQLDVVLQILVSRQPGRLPKLGLTKIKKAADNDRLMKSPEFSDDDDTPTEETKTKRRRRRKYDGVGPRKKIYRKRDITCRFCGDVFKGQVALREHKKSSHPDAKPYIKAKTGPVICEICGKSYKTTHSLTVHRGQHEEYQRFKCDGCPKAFIFQSLLENHKRMEHRQERHICPLCGKQYKYSVDLRHHLLRHEEERPFKCDKCPATFTHSTALHAHKAIHRQAVFTCTICDKNFRFASSLRVHKRLHNRDNYIRCELCEREFSEKALLKKHMAIHSVDREVKCIVCDKIYYKKSELKIHQAKKHPNNPLIGKTIKIYSCNVCCMEFTKDSHLRTHSYIHGTEYSFKCDMCEDQKFKQKAGLRNHWIRFHHLEPPKRNMRKQPEAKKAIDRTVTSETVNCS
ncbi:zinc finger protein 708-like [Ochlerotatus camptorhynchus]|uniref:zinc finger protein 708-like n=1 Tax=Ochlerotatus camptorhynchus TaxID=644619 RepID=UPI0031DD0E09